MDNYLEFDTALFPILYDTNVATPELVSVIRVSPEDTNIYPPKRPGETIPPQPPPAPSKLARTALVHFGAFLDRSFRTNDILWGRLDGAERIIRALLAGDPKKADCIQNLLYDAQETIIEDFLHERKDEFASVIYEVAKSLNSEVREKDKAEAIRAAVKESLGAFNKQPFSQAIERFHPLIRFATT